MIRLNALRSAALVFGVAIALLVVAGEAAAAAACHYEKVAEFDVNMSEGLPLVDVAINGKHGWFWFFNQSNSTTLYKDSAELLALKTYPTSLFTSQNGVDTFIPATHVMQFELGGAPPTSANILVFPSSGRTNKTIWGVLSPTDYAGKTFDYDLPNRKIRIFSERHCDRAPPPGWPASAAPIKMQTRYSAQFDGRINGEMISVQLDTARSTSTIGEAAVKLAGLSVRPASGGGPAEADINGDKVARIGAFDFGGEVFHDVELRLEAAPRYAPTPGEPIGGFRYDDPRNLPPKIILGVDYLMTHRVLISIPQRVAYVAPTGGGLFGPR
jgi:hypothetical protein